MIDIDFEWYRDELGYELLPADPADELSKFSNSIVVGAVNDVYSIMVNTQGLIFEYAADSTAADRNAETGAVGADCATRR